MFRFFRYTKIPRLYLFFFFLSLLPFCFPARTFPPAPQPQPPLFPAADASASASAITNPTWLNFAHFINADKGSNISGISELKSYFRRFGYLGDTAASGSGFLKFTDEFDDDLEAAILNYQKKLGLSLTGKLDPDTVTQIMAPRCGMSDVSGTKLHMTKRYAYFSGEPRWSKAASTDAITLTYGFSTAHMTNYLSYSEIQDVFRRSFARWSSVIPVNFTEADDHRTANIKIGFYSGDHGDGEPFDGVLGVLAHAFSPENGRLHLDDAETWAVDFKTEKSKVAVDLESVATHEIGHILGLAHSSVKDAVMYPSLSPRTKKVDLRIDDVEGIQALYGSNPNFRYSSLYESDISPSWSIGMEMKRSIKWVPTFISFMAFLFGFFSL